MTSQSKVTSESKEGRIFAPVEPLTDLISRVEAERKSMCKTARQGYAGPNIYQDIYSEAQERMAERDVVSVEVMAKKMKITAQDFIDLADRGQAILIEIEGEQFAPLCQLDRRGKIDELKLDIAREFAAYGENYNSFVNYLNFMQKEAVGLKPEVSPKKLKELFKAAGVGDYKCSLIVEATMNQLADRRHQNPSFFPILTEQLKTALTWGGWAASGGLSRPFMDKYKIPGLTLEEELDEYCRQNQKMLSQKPKP